METYKKRGRSGYAGSKEAKSKIRQERQFSKQEITEELKQHQQGEDFRYKHKSKATPNPKRRLENQISRCELRVSRWERYSKESLNSWCIDHCNYLRNQLIKLKDRYESKFGEVNDCS